MSRRLPNPVSYRGWLHAALGAAVWLPAGMVGVVIAVALSPMTAVRPYATITGTVLAIPIGGLLRMTRVASVRLANNLLGAGLPEATPLGGWPTRLRTAGWLLVHALSGGALLAISLGAVIAGAGIPALWLGGGGAFDYLGLSLSVAPGLPGAWAAPFALAHIAVAIAAGAGYVALLRRLVPFLLGPGTAERMAAVQRHADQLAHRNRLARELHDSIGHTLTAATIQAAVASKLVHSDPERARRAMDSIEEASRAALEDLDHVLGVLREGAPTREPQYTLADVPALLDRVRNAGSTVNAEFSGEQDRVPVAVSRETYRIVQEGLTNAMRHSGPITVRIAIGQDSVDIELTNPIAAAPARSTAGRSGGLGLAGIAERVQVLRGEVTAGPVAGDTGWYWRLAAWLPLRSTP
ncbi:histidine kinase [Dactylosporangium sp. NPDC000555]|uniref:sensor histidine kinase n=1 Tax=Dactylosporangium sp. NPDC000555 TaxID=3154260 RepID=UPI0033322D01